MYVNGYKIHNQIDKQINEYVYASSSRAPKQHPYRLQKVVMLSWPEQARLARTPQALKARGSLNGNCLAPSLLPRVEKTPKPGEIKMAAASL